MNLTFALDKFGSEPFDPADSAGYFSGNVTTAAPSFEIKSPTLFTSAAIVTSSLYGFILLTPVLASMLAVTAFHFGLVTFLIPLCSILVATFFLPLGFGNPYISRLVRPLRGNTVAADQVFVVQLTREPRIRSGFMSILEDADDVGVLCYTDSGLQFNGDSVQLRIPYTNIEGLKQQNAGSRALFAYGPATVFRIAGLPQAGTLRLAERSSWILPGSRKNARKLYQALRSRMEPAVAQSGEPK